MLPSLVFFFFFFSSHLLHSLKCNIDINLVSYDSCMHANLATQGDWCKRRRTDSVLSQSAQIGNMDNPKIRIPAEERRKKEERGGRESEGRVDNKRMQGRVKGGGMERRGSRVMEGKVEQESEGEGTKMDSEGCKGCMLRQTIA